MMSDNLTDKNRHSIQTATTLAKMTSNEMEKWLVQIRSSAASIAENLIPTSGAHSDALNIIKICDKTQASVRRLKSIANINDIPLSSDKKDIKVCNVNFCIFDATKSLAAEFEEKKVKLEIKKSARQFPAKADPLLITDVLVAILTNALQASKTDDTVVLDTFQRTINGVPHTVVRIRDNGQGITKNVKDKIFRPFFTTKDPHTALGLGLSIAEKSIEACNGFIRFRSQPDNGSTFSIFVPLAESKQFQRKITKRTELILMVDDRSDCLQTAARILKAEGYSTMDADNAKDAIALLTRNIDSLNLCIIDLSLPGAGSKRILRKISQADKSLPIMVISGFSRDYAREYMERAPFVFLQKPFNDEQFVSAVHKALNNSTQRKDRSNNSSLN